VFKTFLAGTDEKVVSIFGREKELFF